MVLPRERIVKRSPDIIWQDPIHEYLTIGGKSIGTLKISIDHYRAHNESLDRNLRILQRTYDSGSISPRSLFYYGKELMQVDQVQGSAVLINYISTCSDSIDQLAIACFLVASYYYYSDPVKSKYFAELGLTHSNQYAELYCLLGDYWADGRDACKAMDHYKFALSIQIGKAGFTQLPVYYDLYPSSKLAELFYNCQDYKESIKYCDMALKYDPDNISMRQLNILLKEYQR